MSDNSQTRVDGGAENNGTVSGIRAQDGSRNVAKLFDLQHKTLFRTIQDNRESLETLGQLRLQREVVAGHQGGGNPIKFAWLNFDQVAFLLTLTKTTELAVRKPHTLAPHGVRETVSAK